MEDKKPLNKIIRETKGNKKFKVFVKDGDKIKTVRFGDANMSIKRDDPKSVNAKSVSAKQSTKRKN